MCRFLISLFLLVFSTPAFAAIITNTSTSPYFSRFPSKLNTQKYTTTTTRPNYNNRYYPNNRHCPHCCPYNNHYDPYYNRRNYIPVSDLNALERYALNRNYRNESNLDRLERLESLAFGAVQSGDLASRYQNVENAILSRPQNTYRRSVLGNIANYFAGQATGFTPSIMTGATPFGTSTNFMPSQGYSNGIGEQYSSGWFGNRGYGVLDNNFGNGSSVRLLD